MSMFTKNKTLLNTGAACCVVGGSDDCCDYIQSFEYDPNSFLLTITTIDGNVFTVDLSSLAPDGVVDSVSYDPVTSILTITTTAPATYQVTLGAGVVANTVFVMENGSDASGLRERFDFPFATPWAAVAAAQAGDTVIIYPGNYVLAAADDTGTQYLAKDGITIYMYPEAVIEYQNTNPGIGTNPFFDQGIVTNFALLGHGTLLLRKGNTGTNTMSVNSTYTIEVDYAEINGYFRSVAGAYFRFAARKLVSPGNQFNAWRNAVSQESVSIIEIGTFVGGLSTFSCLDHRNFNASSYISVTIGEHIIDNSFAGTGYYYFERCLGSTKLHVGTIRQVAPANSIKFIASFILSAGTYDIDLPNINHLGNFITFNGFAAGGAVTKGKIKISGTITAPTPVGGGMLCNMNAGSTVQIELDLVLIDNTNVAMMNLTNCPATVYVTGKVRHQSSLAAALVALFRYDNPITNTVSTLKDLTVQTVADFLFIGNGPTQLNIPCMGVYCNKGLNPVLHAAAIEPITVSPTVTV